MTRGYDNTASAALLMRGGTSKGPYFEAEDLPADAGGPRRPAAAASWARPTRGRSTGIGGATR